ncbi:MAG: response regulator [Gammaproteobacteria bacterium]|nr:response regulator [Gammaproteobacteria bacterium]NIR32865.1 response regulator [Gammaproteobacteria bacterium]NIR99411.1 response regulator [Gammaproteobacteria bacterium]NIT65025.1 response regulator [Gammaproteobacteria bacterium]NIV21940.1 response regulator [Gammaproteobacteria bacterium]
MKWDIRSRVLFLALIPTGAITAVLGVYFAHTQLAALDQALIDRGRALANNLAPASEYGVATGNPDILRGLARSVLAEPDVVGVSISAANGKTLVSLEQADAVQPMRFRAPITQSEMPVSDFVAAPGTGDTSRTSRAIGWVTIELSHTATSARQRDVILNALGIAALGLVLSALLALHMGQGVIRPILQLKEAVARIGRGRLETRVEFESSAELDALKDGINNMASALGEAHADLQKKIDAATSELRGALENMELQNIELEAARQKALEASRVKSAFLANMSHEIRTPMNAVIGFANLLEKTELDQKQREYACTIKRAANSLLSIIDDVLDFSQLSAGDLDMRQVPFNLQDIMEEAIVALAPSAYEKGLELVLMFYGDVPRSLVGDPTRLRQVVTNLVSNAIKFTSHGSVVVRVMLEEELDDEVNLKVTVQDTGIGLSQKDQGKLFSAFSQADISTTREYGGIGLGLVISKKLVEHMQGRMGLESELGKGSTFWFEFKAARQAGAPPALPGSDRLKGVSCMVYDPHPLMRLAILHQLTEWETDAREVSSMEDLIGELDRASETPAPCRLMIVGLSHDRPDAGSLGALIARTASSQSDILVVLANTADKARLDELRAQGAALALPKHTPGRDLLQEIAALAQGCDKTAGEDTSVEPSARTDLDDLQVLIVDDNDINRKLAVTLYRERGAHVVEAENGEQAVQRAAEREFDLILMDIHMPVMSGVEAANRIRIMQHGRRHTPIVALTANALPEERDRLLCSGLDDCLIKPMHDRDLWAITNRWVKREDAQTAPRSDATPEPPTEPCRRSANQKRASALTITGGNRDLADELYAMLIDELPRMREQINDSYRMQDYARLESEAHKIHGAAAYCAVDSVTESAGNLERAVIREDYANIEDLLSRLNRDIEELLSAEDNV